MKFTSLLKTIIVEQSRFEVLLNALTKPSEDRGGIKTKPRLTKREFIELVKADPTTRLKILISIPQVQKNYLRLRLVNMFSG